jgi:hypothetical protein
MVKDYSVERALEAKKDSKLAADWTAVTCADAKLVKCVASGLTAGKSYVFRVRANVVTTFATGLMTAWTSSAAFVSKGKPDPVSSSTFKQEGFSATAVTLVWTKVAANGDDAGLKYNVEQTMAKNADPAKTVWAAVATCKDLSFTKD